MSWEVYKQYKQGLIKREILVQVPHLKGVRFCVFCGWSYYWVEGVEQINQTTWFWIYIIWRKLGWGYLIGHLWVSIFEAYNWDLTWGLGGGGWAVGDDIWRGRQDKVLEKESGSKRVVRSLFRNISGNVLA